MKVIMDIQQEIEFRALSTKVEQQGQQIAELQKQLASMELTSCELDELISSVKDNSALNQTLANELIEIESIKKTLISFTADSLHQIEYSGNR